MKKLLLPNNQLQLFLLLLFVFSALKAEEKIIFEHLTTNDGLSNGTVTNTFRDSQGFLWICTEDGLNKYDGYNFKIYKPYVNGVKITSNVVYNGIVEDKYGRIWTGSSYGLLYYDRELDKLLTLKSYNTFSEKLDFRLLFTLQILIDHSNNLWIGSYNGLFKIKLDSLIENITEDNIKLYSSRYDDSSTISNYKIVSIVEDRANAIWVSSYENSIDRYNEESDNFTRFPINHPAYNNSTDIRKEISIDGNNNVWIYSEGRGIVLWDRKSDKYELMTYKDKNNEVINTDNVRALIFDSKDRMWIGADNVGLIMLDNNKNEITQYQNGPSDNSNLSSNGIYSIYEDYTGTFWVGTYLAGLNMLSKSKSKFGLVTRSPSSDEGLNYSIVKSFTEDKEGNIWISTNGGGINIYDVKNQKFEHFLHDPNDPKSLSTNVTTAIYADTDNNIWVGTYSGGLNKYNSKTKLFKHYNYDPDDENTISSEHPWGFAQDAHKNLWIATMNNGMNLLKHGSDKFIRYTLSGIKSTSRISSKSCNYIFIDSKQNLWLCTEYGLNKIDLNLVDFSQTRPELVIKQYYVTNAKNNRISFINEDSKGNLWIGTKGKGLIKMNPETEEEKFYDTSNGLSHNTVHGILIDNNENLWISTNSGISRLNPTTEEFTNYRASDGLQAEEFVKTSCLKAKDGMLYFGGVNGFNAFYADNITSNERIPNIVITDFKLFNKSIEVGDTLANRVILTKGINELENIRLLHNENIFEIEFAALDFLSPTKNEYAYKLVGFDEDWRYIDASKRTATYTNLDPGKYTFKVIASNNDGLWNKVGKSFNIIINPPWWNTWWFILITALTVTGALVGAYFYRVNSLRQTQRLLEGMVSQRTAELQNANVELRQLNDTKDKFASIIAHDILNPFNTILGFSDMLVENYDDYSDDERKDTINLISTSSNRLFELLQNLLEWSRSQRGLINIDLKEIDLVESTLQTLTMLNFSASAKKINLIAPKEDQKVAVYSDVNIIRTILRNLVSNAIKFTPTGGTIKVELSVDGKYAFVSIIDNGVGISANKSDSIFEINVQNSTLGTNNEKGTGLGLVLVKDFVSKIGGKITVKSNEGEGSNFTFSVPLSNA